MHFTLSTLTALLLTSTTRANPIRTIELPDGLPRRSENGTLLPRDQNIGKNAHMTLQFWSSPDCQTSVATLWEGIEYNDQMFGRSASFTMSRDLIDKEVLDFSTGGGVPLDVVGMQEAVRPKGAQYPGPGYINGGFNVPSQCDTFFWSMGSLAPAKDGNGKLLCYTPPQVFNCARLWMSS